MYTDVFLAIRFYQPKNYEYIEERRFRHGIPLREAVRSQELEE